ncbi:beta-N-acetylhexosaminidase [Cochlodiniinecator piscidefendens]|uniref:beta-N-acetylhexosaminidase n=1 Tax=Cochlodiniinecator piscidefendens TaxID=2715756 RepID=UPI00140C7325|nr:beta-N-acetylhexosaminidase [Cochlodiniinecator piscidefendens]
MTTGAYIFGCESGALSLDERHFFKEADPWGFILFARNLETPDQIRALTQDLRDSVGRNAPILIDQEGGRVQRLRAPEWREWLPALDHVERDPSVAVRSMHLRYQLIASELIALGIDCNCAPNVDIATPDTHAVLRNRCYGTDVNTVVEIARTVADAHLAMGVLPVMKHIPGHGRANMDSHLELPVVDASAETLHETDFAAFAALADLPMGMSAHIVYSAFGETGPATTSKAMIDLIRTEIGFDGLLMTDDLSMNALAGSVSERTRASLSAGNDLILHCNGERDQMEAVVSEAGPLTAKAQNRAEKALAMRKSPDAVDIQQIESELNALMKQ